MSERKRGSVGWSLAGVFVALCLLVGIVGIGLSNSLNHFGRSFEGDQLRPAPPPSDFGTPREIGTRGDDANPRVLFHGAYPSDADTQERLVGDTPARFSGYTAWIRSVTAVPARRFVDGYSGRYLRAHVKVFNRDTEVQHVCGCDFYVWTRAGGLREADVVKGPTVSPDGQMRSGARREGDVYLYVGNVRGPYYIVYDPDSHTFSGGSAHGVWRARV